MKLQSKNYLTDRIRNSPRNKLSGGKTVILDGTRTEDAHLETILSLLTELVRQHTRHEVQLVKLRDIRIKHCIGCFHCWNQLPGKCVHSDAGAALLQDILQSNTVIFFSPVVFGGYSSEMKKILERFLPLMLPFFTKLDDETRHCGRYPTIPRFVGIGVQSVPQQESNRETVTCFKELVGRNAINYHASGYASEVVYSTDSPDTLKKRFQNLLAGADHLPPRFTKNDLIKVCVSAASTKAVPTGKERRALLISGSPKTGTKSTSAVLGTYLIGRLQQQYGWRTDVFSLKEELSDVQGEHKLCRATDRADLILFSFPLYVDALPFLATKAFEIIASWRKVPPAGRKKLYAIVNNGFPDPQQNVPALNLCRNFAFSCNLVWAGGLALGAGEALLCGHSPWGIKGGKGLRRLPLFNVIRALNIATSALATDQPVPEKAVRLMAQPPLPCISWNSWQWIFIKTANWAWEKEAIRNGVSKDAIASMLYTKKN